MTRICLLMLAVAVLLPGCRTRLDMGISAVNPPKEIPEVKAWCQGKEITMGADTGSRLPAVLFPVAAGKMGTRIRWGEPIQPSPLDVRLDSGDTRRNCPVVHSFFATTDGLVGWPVLREKIWHLDYAAGRHEFAEQLPPEVKNWSAVKLLPGSRAVIEVPHVGRCMLDSGAPHAVYIPRNRWEAFLRTVPDARVGWFHGESPAAGGYFVREVVRVPALRIGRLVLHDVTVCESFSDSPMVILGTESLRQLEVWLDGPGRMLYYRPGA